MTNPNPGSEAAIKLGCKCSSELNHGGTGEPFNEGKNHRTYVSFNCPMHSEFYRKDEDNDVTPRIR